MPPTVRSMALGFTVAFSYVCIPYSEFIPSKAEYLPVSPRSPLPLVDFVPLNSLMIKPDGDIWFHLLLALLSSLVALSGSLNLLNTMKL